MICWVVERALLARNVDRAMVATDDKRIFAAVESAGHEVVMTRSDHASGTDRIAEVAASLDEPNIIVNVQGDEPLISPLTIERAVEAIEEERRKRGIGEKGNGERGEGGDRGKGEREKAGNEIGIVTTWEPIESAADAMNPDIVKVVVADGDRALYFSRLPVPYPRDAVRKHGSVEAALRNEPSLLTTFRKHSGLYVYLREALLAFAHWPQSDLERLESLEQLRALEHGVKIKAIKATTCSIGVDTEEDLKQVRRIMEESEFQVSSSKFQVS
jgi:3-deoxy-manno-octulosonate cytidylyltransferase (CMP-KDO synthetase)